jgi:hypothetical protein
MNTSYTINLAQISLDEFEEILTTTALLPGRRILLSGLPEIVDCIQQSGITHLAALQRALKDKKRYPQLAADWAVSVEYLTVLNREINSYVSKPLPLADLGLFDTDELTALAAAGLKTTRDLYELGAAPAGRPLADRLALPAAKLTAALELCDLLRITGVGPAYARVLRDIGIHSVADYRVTPSPEILARYQQARTRYNLPNIGIKDVEYCKRFSQRLEA